eukprot:312356-Prorocentrum_minimum.AAC.1
MRARPASDWSVVRICPRVLPLLAQEARTEVDDVRRAAQVRERKLVELRPPLREIVAPLLHEGRVGRGFIDQV